MVRKPGLGLTGVILAGMALSGCQNTGSNRAFTPGGTTQAQGRTPASLTRQGAGDFAGRSPQGNVPGMGDPGGFARSPGGSGMPGGAGPVPLGMNSPSGPAQGPHNLSQPSPNVAGGVGGNLGGSPGMAGPNATGGPAPVTPVTERGNGGFGAVPREADPFPPAPPRPGAPAGTPQLGTNQETAPRPAPSVPLTRTTDYHPDSAPLDAGPGLGGVPPAPVPPLPMPANPDGPR
jgi:hypothetical protein